MSFFIRCSILLCIWASSPALSDDFIAAYDASPTFQDFKISGYTRGDRGAEQPNRFDAFMELFAGFTPASQEFILCAFNAGQLVKVEAGKDRYFENGKLAANLVRMTADIEIMARFIETRVIPKDQQIPRASDNFDRMIRNFPEVVSVLNQNVQSGIVALEEQVLVTLRDENKALERQLSVLKDENTAFKREGEVLDRLNTRLDTLLNAFQG